MSEHYLECVGCGRDYPMSTVNARCHQCDEPLEVRFNLGSLPHNWFLTERTGFFARRYRGRARQDRTRTPPDPHSDDRTPL